MLRGFTLATVVLTSSSISLAAIVESAKYTYSPTGLGQVTFTPGVNVQDFVVFGNPSSGTGGVVGYSGTAYISRSISGDGTSPNAEFYGSTYFNWSSGAPVASHSGMGQYQYFQPVASPNGYDVTPFTQAALTVTAPASSFTAQFFVHNYYVGADLDVFCNGKLVQSYEGIMNPAPGTRDGDYFYDFSIAGATAGDVISFKVSNVSNKGTIWANFGIVAASVDFVAPANLTAGAADLTVVPEPTIATVAGTAALAVLGLRRQRRKA